MRVLLVDDDLGVRKVLRAILQRAGHEVVEADNGLQAITQLRTTKIDLVLTDIVMPIMDGLQLIKFARDLIPSLKIIAMSGGGRTTNTDYLEVARQQGATALLQKPFTSGDVHALMAQCFGAGASPRSA